MNHSTEYSRRIGIQLHLYATVQELNSESYVFIPCQCPLLPATGYCLTVLILSHLEIPRWITDLTLSITSSNWGLFTLSSCRIHFTILKSSPEYCLLISVF